MLYNIKAVPRFNLITRFRMENVFCTLGLDRHTLPIFGHGKIRSWHVRLRPP